MENQIQIRTSLKTYRFNDQNGKRLFDIELNPTDADIIRRAEIVGKKLQEFKPKNVEDLAAYSDEVKKQLDFLVNADISGKVFQHCGPMSVLDSGRFFFEEVYDAIIKIIGAEIEEKSKQAEKRISQYTQKYQKK